MSSKLDRVREWMSAQNADAVVLNRRDNFAWITDGGDNHIVSASDFGVATVVVTPSRAAVVTKNIEAARIGDEELANLPVEVIHFPYYEEKLADIVRSMASGRILSDAPSTEFEPLPGSFVEMRYVLTPDEIARYRELGKAVCKILCDATKAVEPGMTEHQIAADIARRCYAQGIEPTVDLVAADDRIRKYRHPIPTALPVKKTAMLVVCARRQGLVAAITRFVSFGPVSDEIRAKHQAVCRIDLRFLLATQPNRRVRDVYKDGVEEYAKTGYAEEWALHHQGGGIGYLPREYIATPTTDQIVHKNQAFAWNPSITGAKTEDTFIVTESGPEVITTDPSWPMIDATVDGVTMPRPDIYVK